MKGLRCSFQVVYTCGQENSAVICEKVEMGAAYKQMRSLDRNLRYIAFISLQQEMGSIQVFSVELVVSNHTALK